MHWKMMLRNNFNFFNYNPSFMNFTLHACSLQSMYSPSTSADFFVRTFPPPISILHDLLCREYMTPYVSSSPYIRLLFLLSSVMLHLSAAMIKRDTGMFSPEEVGKVCRLKRRVLYIRRGLPALPPPQTKRTKPTE